MKLQLKTKSVISYLSKKEISKLLPISEYKSVSQVLSNPKQKAWFKAQMKDKDSAMSKATRQGTKTHKALESGEAKDAFTIACLEAFEKDVLVDIDEIWGQEEWLAHPLGYKGKFDGVGIFRGKLTLFDHKKTNKPKTGSGLTGYFKQLMAYHQAHTHLYAEHPIEQVAIFNIFGKSIEEIGTSVTTLDSSQMAKFLTEFNGRLCDS